MPVSTNIVTPSLETLTSDINMLNQNVTKLGNDYGKVLGLTQSGLNGLYNKYTKDPSSVTGGNELDYVRARAIAEGDIFSKNNLKNKVTKGLAQLDLKIDDALKTVKGIQFSDGTTLFTSKELYDVDVLLNKYYTIPSSSLLGMLGGGVGSPGGYPVFNETAFRKSLGNNPNKLAIATALIKQLKNQPLTSVEKNIAQRMTDIHKGLSSNIKAIQNEKMEYQEKTISKYDPSYQSQYGTIDKNNVADMTIVDNIIGNTIVKLNSSNFGVDIKPGERLDATTLSKMRAKNADGKLNVSPIIIKNYDGSGILELHQGDDVQTIHLSASNFQSYYPEYAKSNPFTKDFSDVAASEYKTTNRSDGPGNKYTDAITAAHTGFDIPGLKGTTWANKVRYDIIGSQKNDGGPDDRFGIRLFIYNKGTWMLPIESMNGYKSGAGVQQDIEQLIGPDTIEGLLKKYK